MEDSNIKEKKVSVKNEEASHTNSSSESQGEPLEANPSGHVKE